MSYRLSSIMFEHVPVWYLIFFYSLTLFSMAGATVICVDDDNITATRNGSVQNPYAAIQAAVNIAASGDTVKVATGIYNETVAIRGKTIKLLGGYVGATSATYTSGNKGDFTLRDPEGNVTKITGRQDTNTVDITNATHCKIDGFTITGGKVGVHMIWGLAYDTVSNNFIEHNGDFIKAFDYRDGAGIYISDGSHECILNNIIRNNTSPNRGAGIFINDDTGFVIRGNLVDDNVAYGDHGAGVFLGGWGTTTENIIQNNHFFDDLGNNWAGGVILLVKQNFSYNIVRGNRAGKYTGVYTDEGAETWIDHCLIYRNRAAIGGAGIGVDEAGNPCTPSRAHITNCTVVNNYTEDYSGSAIYNADSWAEVKNCIFWGNRAGHGGTEFYSAAEECPVTQSSLSVTFTLSTTLQSGTGNISADPLFADTANGDFHLKSSYGRWNPATSSWLTDNVTSPAIDAGDPNSPVGQEPQPNGSRINMGAYGGTAEASRSAGSVSKDLDRISQSMFRVWCSPSSFSSSTNIYYQLPHSASVRLQVFTQNGIRVADLENGFRSAGPHRLAWKAQQGSGVYYVQLTAGEYQAIRKIIKK